MEQFLPEFSLDLPQRLLLHYGAWKCVFLNNFARCGLMLVIVSLLHSDMNCKWHAKMKSVNLKYLYSKTKLMPDVHIILADVNKESYSWISVICVSFFQSC